MERQDDDISADIERHADMLFSRNMERHGFSFTPRGLMRAAYDRRGRLHHNWKLKMRLHQPLISEHPVLYERPRYYCLSATGAKIITKHRWENDK